MANMHTKKKEKKKKKTKSKIFSNICKDTVEIDNELDLLLL